MTLDRKNIAIGALVLVIVLLAFFLGRQRKPETIRDTAAEDSLNAELTKARQTTQEIAQKFGVDTVRKNVAINGLIIENNRLKSKQVILRPQVQVMADTSAILQEFLTVQDSIQASDSTIIAHYVVEVAELRDVASQMIKADEVKERLRSELFKHQEAVIQQQGKEIKRLKRVILIERIAGAVVTALVIVVAL